MIFCILRLGGQAIVGRILFYEYARIGSAWMIPFLCRAPDSPNWQGEARYNPTMATLFMDVYKQISSEARRPPADEMDLARKHLPALHDDLSVLSDHQRFALAILHCELALGGASGEPVARILASARHFATTLKDPLVLAECDFIEG